MLAINHYFLLILYLRTELYENDMLEAVAHWMEWSNVIASGNCVFTYVYV